MTRKIRHLLSLTAAAGATFATQVALACPVCAQRDDGGWMSDIALGAMVLSPWAVTLTVGLWIRKNGRSENEPLETTTEDDTPEGGGYTPPAA